MDRETSLYCFPKKARKITLANTKGDTLLN